MKPGRVARSDTQLLAASVAASLAGAGFVIAVEGHLGTDGFEPVAQLWNMWAISAAFLTLSLQLSTIGSIGAGFDLDTILNRHLMFGVLFLAAAFGALAIAYDEELYNSTSRLWPVLAVLVPVGAAAMGVTRGYWAGIREFATTAAVIGSENLIRLAAAVVLILVGAGAGWFGLAIVVGFAPVLLTPWRRIRVAGGHASVDRPSAANAVAGAAALAALLSFATFSSAPVLIAVNGGTDTAASAAFLALALTRIPQGLAQGVIPRLSVAANSAALGPDAVLPRLWQRQAGAITLAAGPILAVVGAFVLGPIAQLLFGVDARLSRSSYGFAMLAAVLNLGLIGQIILLAAQRRIRLLAAGWLSAVPVAIGAVALSELASPRSVFAAASAIELVVLSVYVLWPAPVTVELTPEQR